MAEQKRVTRNIKMEGARLIFKNFSGRATAFNEEGKRNFGVLLNDPGLVEDLIADGWPVKFFPIKEDEPPQAWMKVQVKFGMYPPSCNLITIDAAGQMHRTRLDEETIGLLDGTMAENVDLVIRPYNYPAIGRNRPAGVSAYLKSIYYTLPQDDIESKYAAALED